MDVPDPAVHRAGQPVAAVAAGQQQRHRRNNAVIERTVISTYTCPTRGREPLLQPVATAAGCGSGPPTSAPTAPRPEGCRPTPPAQHNGMGTDNFEAAAEHGRGSPTARRTRSWSGERYMARSRYTADDWGGEPITRGFGWGIARRCRGLPTPTVNRPGQTPSHDGDGQRAARSAHTTGFGFVYGRRVGQVPALQPGPDHVPQPVRPQRRQRRRRAVTC